MRAELLYDTLKGRDNLTPLQESFLILVHMRKKQEKLREMEMLAITGIREHNHKQIQSVLEAYREILLPGFGDKAKEETFEEKARKNLAEEAKKVYVMRPYSEGNREGFEKMAKSDNFNAKAIAGREIREMQRKEGREEERKQRRAKKERKI